MLKRDSLRETLIVAEPIRKTMRGNRSKNTKPEIAMRRALWSAGMRGYRVHARDLSGSPDIVFLGPKLVVFIHGCFWHGCPHCSNYRPPRRNAEFWQHKLQENQNRDARVSAELRACGYQVVVVWECQIDSSKDNCVLRIRNALNEVTRDER